MMSFKYTLQCRGTLVPTPDALAWRRWASIALLGAMLLIGGCASQGADPAAATPANPQVSPHEVSPHAVDSAAVAASTATGEPVPAMVARSPQRFDEDLEAYLIGPRDLLEIKVFEVDELSSKARVNRRGSITLPLIGAIKVQGRNVTEVEALIEEALAREYLQDPHVAVFIEEFASQRFTVEGFVKKPGVFNMQGQTTLIQAIATAGGVSEIADTEQVFVFRNPYGTQREVLEFNLNKIHDGKQPDPLLQGTDIVVVDSSAGRKLIRDVTKTLRGFIGFGTLPVF